MAASSHGPRGRPRQAPTGSTLRQQLRLRAATRGMRASSHMRGTSSSRARPPMRGGSACAPVPIL
eukprot:scaffold994_cov226-Prasinococcus_capsulatus_cf.AAC.6